MDFRRISGWKLKFAARSADTSAVRQRRCRRSRALAVALAVLLTGPVLMGNGPAALAAPGGVGPVFDDTGMVYTSLRPSSADFGTALAVQPDGRVVVAAGAGGDFGLARLSANLTQTNDLGFADRRVITDFAGTDDIPRAVAVTGSGRFLTAGSAGGDLAVARYDGRGVLDRSFDGDGRLTVDLGGPDDAASAVIPLADDRVVVVGGTSTAASVLRFLADGRPDPSFGTAGRVTLASSGPGRAAALQPDATLLVAGGGDTIVVHRLLPDGRLDSAFGVDGVASVAVGAPARANGMVSGPDGSVTVAGTRGGDVVVARLGPTGRPDPTFGTEGVTVTAVAGGGTGQAVARRADGSLLVVGDAGNKGLLVRYRPDGSLETSFGTGGIALSTTNLVTGEMDTRLRAVIAHPDQRWIVVGSRGSNAIVGEVPEPSGVTRGTAVDFGSQGQKVAAGVVQPDGKILAVSQLGGDTAIVRYNLDGSRDGAFGVAGIVISDHIRAPRAVAVQPGGRILVAGSTTAADVGATVAGYRPDGSLDTTFGNDGRTATGLTTTMSSIGGLAVLPDGRMVLAGAGDGGGGVVRFTAGGQPDLTFGGGDGRVSGSAPGYSGVGLTLQGDGRMLLNGSQKLFRLDADGSPDPGFGIDGVVTFSPNNPNRPAAVAVQPDGRILIALTTDVPDIDMVVLRLMPDGSPDGSWHRALLDFQTLNPASWTLSNPSAVALQPDGKVVVGGDAGNAFALARLHPDGTRDTSFGVGGLMNLRVTRTGLPVLVVPTATSGTLLLGTGGDGGWPSDRVALARIATGPLGAPTNVTAVAGSGSARVSWARPPAFDESPALAYRVSASDGVHTATTPDGEHFSTVVRGLIPGRSYTFTVHAMRAAGAGPASAPSNAVTATMSGPTSAWGWNGPSTLGDGTTLDRLRPLTGAGSPGAVALAGGAWHSLSLRADGTVWAWGWNTFGQLGDGTTTIRSTPVQVRGLTDVVAVAAGAYHSLALRADGSVWAWGWNGVGQLGTGSTIDAVVPVPVQGLSGVTAISAGFHHGLAVRADGTVAAWGWNVTGQLGDGTTADRWRPQSVPGPTGITAVAGGALHSMAMTGDGRLWTWGSNVVAQLGTHDLVDRRTATESMSVYDIKAIAAGAFHSFALGKNGEVRSWGYDGYGQMGRPKGADPASVMWVWNLRDVASISSGWYHGLAIKHDGSVFTWGWNVLGQLGDGTTRDRWEVAPVAVPPAIAIAGGALHSLAA